MENKYKLTYQNVLNGELWSLEVVATSPLGAVIKGAEDVKTLQAQGEQFVLHDMCESKDESDV